MVLHDVIFDEDLIARFCERHRVVRLSLFGSILRSDFTPISDIDVLVEFESGSTPGMLGFGGMILELSAMLGRTVDLRTLLDLSPHFRSGVVRDARVVHGVLLK